MTVRSTALSSTKRKRRRCLVRFALDSPLEGSGFEPSVPLGEKRSFRNASIRELHRAAYEGGRKRYRRGRPSGSRRSDHSQHGYGVGAAGKTCGLNSGNLNILSEARIHAPELISDQVSVDPIEEVLCSSLVSREVRR